MRQVDDAFYKEMDGLIEDLTPIEDMAILLRVPYAQFRQMLDDVESPVSKHFQMKVAEVRRRIRHRDIELAEANSPTAIQAVDEHLKNMMNSLL